MDQIILMLLRVKIIYIRSNTQMLFFIHVHKFILLKLNETSNSRIFTSKQELDLGKTL